MRSRLWLQYVFAFSLVVGQAPGLPAGKYGNRSGCPTNSTRLRLLYARKGGACARRLCCKILRAVVFAKTKDWARNDAKFCDANFPVLAGAFVVYSSRAVTPLLLDTGPPGALSFAELILQQSLLAHAPPVLV